MKYYANPDGTYAGAWHSGTPTGLIEVPAPEHPSQTWTGEDWEDTPATSEWRLAQINTAVSDHLDGVAVNLGYDDIATAVTYAADETNPHWQDEAIALRKFRGAAWTAVDRYLANTQAPTQAGAIAAIPPMRSVVGYAAYRAMILRRADDIALSDPAGALLLRQSVA